MKSETNGNGQQPVSIDPSDMLGPIHESYQEVIAHLTTKVAMKDAYIGMLLKQLAELQKETASAPEPVP